MEGQAPISPSLLRVAYLTPSLSPHRLALVECIADSVKDLRVFLCEAEDSMHHFPQEWGHLDVVLQRTLNWTHHFLNAHGYQDVSYIHLPYDTYLQLSRYRPDVVISAEFGARTVLSVLYRLMHPKTRLILWATVSDHTESVRGFFRRLLRRWIIRNVDVVLVNGESGARYVRNLGYKHKLFVAPYAIDPKRFSTQTYEPEAGQYRLLYTGNLIPRKGLPGFCKVLAAWCEAHPATRVTFRMVGEGDDASAIRQIEMPENLKIEIYDRMDHDRLIPFYEWADIYAFPSLGDEWGVVINEALNARRPVLGSIYSQAVVELIKEGENGWLFDPQSAESAYAAIDRALTTDASTLQALSASARKAIEALSPTLVAKRVVDALVVNVT